MKKRNQRLPFILLSPKRFKKYLLSLVFTLICTLIFWIQEQHASIRTPDSNNPIELLANQVNDNLTTVFSSVICGAKKSVLLIVYSLTDNKIIDCLNNASLKGVKVKVICDAKASPRIDAKLGGNIDITRRFGPGLMHQKILVIDNEKVWLGSANMTTDSLRFHGNLMTALHSDSLAEKIHAKAETLKTEGRGISFPTQHFILGGQPIELWFLPENQDAVHRLKTLIRSAKKTIRIAMFTWTRQDFAKEVIKASKRGVKTEVVIDRYQGKGASSKIVELFTNSGVNIGLSTKTPLLHHKFLYIDDQILVNGSANWTKAAFTQNDDCFIVMHNLTDQQNEQMEALWKIILNESSPPK